MNGAMWRVVSRGSSLIFHSKKRNALSVTARAFSAPTGLYGLPHLKTAKGFQSFVDEAIQRSGELISYICKKQPAGEVMRAMDEISDTVCSVVDSAELCRHTHPDREFVEEASKASMRINEYLHYLNTNHDLYDAIKKAEQECHMLSEEAKRGVRNLRADFERGGINLCSGKLDQVNTLNIEISQLCREYNENIVMDPGTVDIYPSSRIPRNLHYLVKPIHRSVSLITKDLSGSRGILKEKGFRITTDPQTVSSVLQFSSDDEVRKMVYIRGNSVPQANVDVLKRLISARHELAQGDLGYLYLDLYSRKGKYPGCAHFAIKGGRRISQTEYQLPIVALVCNFPGSQNPSAVRLNHWEVETLFHEFGHALHSLLSRTDYQHFSGTRAVLDFAEIPSNLFEYYAWDYRVLRKFARHYSTGEQIPQKLVESMQGARDMFAATELQRQIFYALVDQTLFGEQPLPHGDISSVVAELKGEHTNYGHVEGTHWETRFSHLLNYGAGYYSYLYAKCFAATIWKKLCEEDPLSSTTGFALRTKFLQHGGAREPDALLNDLMGDGIYRYHDGGIVPDISCLCNEMKLVEEYPMEVHL
ncbi:mitochondrial intermediate peptidase, mitochondrial isoform X8 [Vigna angularis]|uniref:mitochondrial intermediate peptidase, mitochondrial isoform X8 n=1 Tax=Phaseolus angularis TaxID=3914 RepID=UPI0022B4C1D5|nr:mitochondrial intermediate peptidase, mitochondrial isoform X8 [Vigna angularis]